MENQRVVDVLRAQYSQRQDWLTRTMEGVTDEVAHYTPPGAVSSIAAQMVHVVTNLDFWLIGLIAGKEPLLTTSFAGKSGISDPPTLDSQFDQFEWLREWGKKIKVDLSAFHEYNQAVFAEIDSYLASLTDDELQEKKTIKPDLTVVPLKTFDIMMLDITMHTGEISCIKGLQGLKGYPV